MHQGLTFENLWQASMFPCWSVPRGEEWCTYVGVGVGVGFDVGAGAGAGAGVNDICA